MARRFFNTLFLLAFALSALVQFNDSDALQWIAVYLAAAAICLARYRAPLPRWIPGSLLLLAAAWIAILLPAIIGQVTPAEVLESISMRTRAVEEAREVGGLALVAIWTAVLTAEKRS